VDAQRSLVVMVAGKADLDPVTADRVTRATVDAFLERLSGGEARDLAARLPAELVRPVHVLPDRRAEPFDLDEFLRRVAETTGTDLATAERYAEAVLTALRVVVGADEYAEAVAQLPSDFQPMIAETRRSHVEVRSTVEFIARVASRAGIRMSGARRATDAVLETLGERLPHKDAKRLTSRLPGRLREPIERGTVQTAAPRRLGAEKFVELVAEREHSMPDRAQRDTGAVLATMGDALPEEYFYDTVVLQLPNDYAGLLVSR
jgi:uncharacterized protein (DUF2267 family)